MKTLKEILEDMGARISEEAEIDAWLKLVDEKLVDVIQNAIEAHSNAEHNGDLPAKVVLASIAFLVGASMARNINATTPTDLCEMLSSIGDFTHAIGHAEYEAMRTGHEVDYKKRAH